MKEIIQDEAGAVAAASRTSAPVPKQHATCPAPAGTGLQDVTTGAAAPYFIHSPEGDARSAATVVFLPGGSGGRGRARRAWERFFAAGVGMEAFRVVIPYSLDSPFIDEARRTFAIVDAPLECASADPIRVHLAGASNGGLAAFALMMDQPERFATLLGAPGAFPVQDASTIDPAVWLTALAGRAVLNGVGALDAEWRTEGIVTHSALSVAGVESTHVDFAGQGRIPGETFNAGVLPEF